MTRIVLLLGIATMFGLSSMCHGQTPHTLLWSGTPQDAQRAIEIMEEDPTWVARRDSDGRTPLHVAARFNQIEVVKWLLENGADVDAQANNKFTPLHLTEKPEIVRTILDLKQALRGRYLQALFRRSRMYPTQRVVFDFQIVGCSSLCFNLGFGVHAVLERTYSSFGFQSVNIEVGVEVDPTNRRRPLASGSILGFCKSFGGR